MVYYAHSLPDAPPGQWQTLTDHLVKVAELAERMARVFGAGPWGRAAGLLHDAGKGTEPAQHRLRGGPAVDHSSVGAQEAVKQFGPAEGKLLAYVIAGHHGGMPDGTSGQRADIRARLKKQLPPLLCPRPGNWSP